MKNGLGHHVNETVCDVSYTKVILLLKEQ